MKNRKKMIVMILTTTILISALSGCGSNSNSNLVSGNSNVLLNSETVSNSGNTTDTSDNVPEETVKENMNTILRGSSLNNAYGNFKYKRNEYGLYTEIEKYDENGTLISSTKTMESEYDENGLLKTYIFDKYSHKYEFKYDDDGKMRNIAVYEPSGELSCVFKYAENNKGTYQISGQASIINGTSGTYILSKSLKPLSYDNDENNRHKDYKYDSDDRLIKTETYVITPVNANQGKKEWELKVSEENTYDENGLLIKTDITRHRISSDYPLFDDKLYELVYSSDDYDEQGRCAYSYLQVDYGAAKGTVYEKTPTSTWTYEYYPDGKLKKESETLSNGETGKVYIHDDSGMIIEYHKAGVEYTLFPVIDDELLLAFYNVCGEKYL